MSISSTGKAASPRQRRAKLKGETTVEVENNQGQAVDNDNNTQNTDKSETPGTLAIAGIRPIASSDLQVAETVSIAGLRPISASNLEIVGTIDVMGIRPIGANHIQVFDSINLSGMRPISSSALVISNSYSVMGNRPVASNIIDDSEILMGFID
ncbi:hypothetical protein NIES21_31660 [Anabaenopsis circularis NIES-21]|uniref:Uncharacterized protein n=1 Tax=Anabaenopsis circularis NIES-21 TaxID=1085406 RepID=A0A1Z4GIN8_9CYAN|nr:hypothetical protein [Nostoc cycadae]BAY17329.1 hypothetical protein NIES21_31660 [Anabaenopsis circularis NIES-21]